MKYALLVYDRSGSWHDISRKHRHALHDQYQDVATSAGVISHFRLRSPKKTTTIRIEEGEVVEAQGPLTDTSRETFRALYIIESEDLESALDLAAHIPAAGTGGAVEVWPLIERAGKQPH